MIWIILTGVFMAATRKIEVDSRMRPEDALPQRARSQSPADALRRVVLANAPIHFLTHFVE